MRSSKRHASVEQVDLFEIPSDPRQATPTALSPQLSTSPTADEHGLAPTVAEADVGPIATASVPVPTCDGEFVTLELMPDHTIWVRRGRAWCGSHIVEPECYKWLGGIPDPDEPSAPSAGPYGPDDTAWSDPILAVMLANNPDRRVGAGDRRLARLAWAELWTLLAPHLDARAARLCVTYGYLTEMYQLLVQRPDLCDHLEVCPALGPFMTREKAEVIPPRGWSLNQIAAFVLASKDGTPAQITPGFMAWARGFTWNQERLPLFKGDHEKRLAWMRGLVRNALRAGPLMDPNGVHKLESDDEWLLVNTALSMPGTIPLVPGILANPKAAINRVEKYFPPDVKVLRLSDRTEIRLDRRGKIERTLEVARQWVAAHPEEAKSVKTFSSLLKRARTWDQQMWHLEQDQMEAIDAWYASEERRLRIAQERLEEEVRRLALLDIDYLPSGMELDDVFGHVLPAEHRVYEEGRYRMIQLATPADLLAEGNLMGHCVGRNGFIEDCARGRIYIFSVRDRHAEDRAILEGFSLPQPIATVEASAETYAIRQQQGPGNTPLSPEVKQFIIRGLQHFREVHNQLRKGTQAHRVPARSLA